MLSESVLFLLLLVGFIVKNGSLMKSVAEGPLIGAGIAYVAMKIFRFF